MTTQAPPPDAAGEIVRPVEWWIDRYNLLDNDPDVRDALAEWLHRHGVPRAELADALDEIERVALLPSLTPAAERLTALSQSNAAQAEPTDGNIAILSHAIFVACQPFVAVGCEEVPQWSEGQQRLWGAIARSVFPAIRALSQGSGSTDGGGA